jgi:hypothetical protein
MINTDFDFEYQKRKEEFLKYKSTLPKEPEIGLKEYYVGCYDKDGWEYVHEILMKDGTLEDNIPSHSCICVNDCLHSETRGIYLLTDDEAEELRNHPKVNYVIINTGKYPGTYSDNPDDISTLTKIDRYSTPVKHQRYIGATTIIPSSPDSSLLNRGSWQLKRHQQKTNPWQASSTSIFEDKINQYGDGTDIDIIVADTEMWFGHIEFQNRYDYATSEFNGNVVNIPELIGPKGYRGGNLLPGNGSCDILDLVLDAPYYLDPDFFNADSNNRLMTRWDGTIVPTESAARGWWSNNSLQYRSSKFVSSSNGGTAIGDDDFGSITINSSYTRARCNGSNTAKQTGSETHGTSCASLAYGRQYGWAYNANKWFLNMYGTGSNSYAVGFDLQKIFHKIKPINPSYGNKNPTVSSNSWGLRQEVRENNTAPIDLNESTTFIHQISLGETWNSSNITGITTSISLRTEEIYPSAFFFKPDGSKCYVIGSQKILYEYNLTDWNISTLSYSGNSFSFESSLSGENVYGMFFKPQGDKLYILTSNGTSSKIFEFNLINWNISTIQSTNNTFSRTGKLPGDLFFKPDGTKLYILSNDLNTESSNSNSIYQYNLSTPWNITNATFEKSITVGNNIATGLFFKDDGLSLYVIVSSNTSTLQRISKTNLTSSWDIGTQSSFVLRFFDFTRNPQSIFFKPDGSNIFVIGDTKKLRFYYKFRNEPWNSFSIKDTGALEPFPEFMNYYRLEQNVKRRVCELTGGHPAITSGQELINSGVIFVAAAGNNNQKLVKSNHPDYNNYHSNYQGLTFEESTTNSIYSTVNFHPTYNSHNRPGFPIHISKNESGEYKCVIVGALNDVPVGVPLLFSDSRESKASYSNMGNAVDCFCAADDVLAATTGTSGISRYDNYYYLNNTKSLINLDVQFNGTSAACPVAAGIIATKLQYSRDWTIDDVKNWISGLESQTSESLYFGTESITSSDSTWSDSYNMQGNLGIVLYDDALTGNEPSTLAEISSISDFTLNPGDVVNIQVSSSDLLNGTYYYTIEAGPGSSVSAGTSISSSDFSNNSLSGSFEVSSGNGTISLTIQ